MRKIALSLTAATAITASTIVAPAASAAETAPATGLSANSSQLVSNAGVFGWLALLGGSVIAIYAVLSALGNIVA